MKNFEKDERIIQEKRKIQSNGFLLVILLLFASMIIQFFIFPDKPEVFMGEYITWMIGCLYILVCNIKSGIAKKSKMKNIVLGGIVGAIASFFVINFVLGEKGSDFSYGFPIGFMISFIGGYYIINFFVGKKEKEIEKALDEEDKKIQEKLKP
ncbi:MAG: hypothetical protein Q4Q07_09960 [Tissierellia bacterium]|nr:hypothetical protein [Tissierellia bacterium]